MMPWGSNPTALREVANMCNWGADITDLRIQILERAIEILQASAWGNWVRPYIEMLRQVIKVLRRVMALLQEYTKMLNTQAEQQDRASGTRTGGGGGGGTGGGGGGQPTGSPQASNVLQDLTNMFKSGKEFLDALNQSQQPNVDPNAAASQNPTSPQTPATTPQVPATSPQVPVDTPKIPADPLNGGPGDRAPVPSLGGTGKDLTGVQPASAPYSGGGGGGGLDSRSPLDRSAGPTPGHSVIGSTPLVGPQGGVLADVGLRSGGVSTDRIPFADKPGGGIHSGILAGAIATGVGVGTLAAHKATDKAGDGEPNATV